MSNQEITVVCAECKCSYTTTNKEYTIENLCSDKCRHKSFGRKGLGKTIDLVNTEARLMGDVYVKQAQLSREEFMIRKHAERMAKIKSLRLI